MSHVFESPLLLAFVTWALCLLERRSSVPQERIASSLHDIRGVTFRSELVSFSV